jgi:hypothetical protein
VLKANRRRRAALWRQSNRQVWSGVCVTPQVQRACNERCRHIMPAIQYSYLQFLYALYAYSGNINRLFLFSGYNSLELLEGYLNGTCSFQRNALLVLFPEIPKTCITADMSTGRAPAPASGGSWALAKCPPEVLKLILQQLALKDIKNLRLLSKCTRDAIDQSYLRTYEGTKFSLQSCSVRL